MNSRRMGLPKGGQCNTSKGGALMNFRPSLQRLNALCRRVANSTHLWHSNVQQQTLNTFTLDVAFRNMLASFLDHKSRPICRRAGMIPKCTSIHLMSPVGTRWTSFGQLLLHVHDFSYKSVDKLERVEQRLDISRDIRVIRMECSQEHQRNRSEQSDYT